MNWALPFLHGGSLEITLIVPLIIAMIHNENRPEYRQYLLGHPVFAEPVI